MTRATKNANATRQSKIAASWKDKKVRAARLQRVGVRVGRYEYASVAVALADLGMPASRLGRVRKALKAEGEVKIDNKTFRAIKR